MDDIKTRISRDRMDAMRARDSERKATLDYILGQIQKTEKDPNAAGKSTDDIATASIAAYVKSLRENIVTVGAAKPEQATRYQAEIDLLAAYMPRALSDDEIRAEVAALQESGTAGRGMLMKALKAKHGAALDGKRATGLLEEMGIK